ncbi:phosphatidylglycerol/phosphatidylinositol transfer protein-like [Durio zibethinus]|uniref:Phosphatidylglycerol/phosphatidylinositol transfer protein-like n=1 Tax=Durio zibethinus TaxID=66656 RepID=A0A6P5ZPC6_DURZI|nr:phosphatidylglycerol/phosphatidylinositol transfer protein-like [Durio zibethinus]
MEILAQFNIILVLFFTVFLLSACNQAENVTYCNDSRHYIVNVLSFEVSPDPMLVGRPATIIISASTSQPISDGKAVIDVSFLGLHVHTETRDLCEEVSCPVAAGNFVLSHSQTLPVFRKQGSYTLQMTLHDENNLELTCIRIKFIIGNASFASNS